jgi:hypothetical protein
MKKKEKKKRKKAEKSLVVILFIGRDEKVKLISCVCSSLN